ncbi:MAG: GNAT family N-acetyltransferase [Sulfuritalea sp.]|nr:GNAT family N-acetyltransferase [Sulfuritalea sp.]
MLIIRRMTYDDIDAANALQSRVYLAIPPFGREQFGGLLDRFPDGQIVAEIDGRLVGLALSLVILWDDYSLHHTWDSVTNNAEFDTHDMSGRTLYGVEVCVDPDAQGRGVGHALYEARRTLCRAMNLKRVIAGGRLPGYREHAAHMSPEEYAKRVIWGDFYDPVLRFQLREGFDFCGILHGYLPTDEESIGNASLIVWLNPEYKPELPTRQPPADFFKVFHS